MATTKPAKNTDNSDVSLPDLQTPPSASEKIPWKCLLFKLWYNLTYLFKNPYKKPKRELNLLQQVEVLINTGEPGTVIQHCENYIYLHRIVENTRARRRLERWITRLISIYLSVVLTLIVASYILSWNLHLAVIITILSTTTINIVALGYILVRGLFHENEENDIKKEKPQMNKQVT